MDISDRIDSKRQYSPPGVLWSLMVQLRLINYLLIAERRGMGSVFQTNGPQQAFSASVLFVHPNAGSRIVRTIQACAREHSIPINSIGDPVTQVLVE